MEWPAPWLPIAGGSSLAEGLVAELGRELAPGHPLTGIPVVAAGRHGENDDALFRLLDGTDRVAVVHLTWSGHVEQPPWPVASLFEGFDDWAGRSAEIDSNDSLR